MECVDPAGESYYGYNRLRCRCVNCREAKRIRRREQERRRLARIPRDGPRFAVDALEAHWGPFTIHNHDTPVVGSNSELLAEVLGVSRRTVQRWRKEGIPEHYADKLACRIGTHPSLIWETWFSCDGDAEPAASS